MMPKLKILLILLLNQTINSQTIPEKLLHGKIVVESGQVAGVTIINLVNEKSTVSNTNGEFSILAKPDDLLVFSSVALEYQRRSIDKDDFKLEPIIIKMTVKITALNEVVINKDSKINAVALGISPKGIVQRTQMERRLYKAGDFKPIHLLGLLDGHLEVDPILNAINGRTAMTKNFIKVENKIILLKKLNKIFKDDFYLNSLKLPSEYITGFKYYIIENEKFIAILETMIKSKIEFEMVSLATIYNQVLLDEK